jgi:hypothetical protein
MLLQFKKKEKIHTYTFIPGRRLWPLSPERTRRRLPVKKIQKKKFRSLRPLYRLRPVSSKNIDAIASLRPKVIKKIRKEKEIFFFQRHATDIIQKMASSLKNKGGGKGGITTIDAVAV